MSWQSGSLLEKKECSVHNQKGLSDIHQDLFYWSRKRLGCEPTGCVLHVSLTRLDARGLDPADFPTDQNTKKKCNRQSHSKSKRFGHVVGFGVLSVAPFEHVIHGQTKACDNGNESQCRNKDHGPIIPLKR